MAYPPNHHLQTLSGLLAAVALLLYLLTWAVLILAHCWGVDPHCCRPNPLNLALECVRQAGELTGAVQVELMLVRVPLPILFLLLAMRMLLAPTRQQRRSASAKLVLVACFRASARLGRRAARCIRPLPVCLYLVV